MRKKLLVLFTVTLILAGIVSPFASKYPDGLQRVAEDHGFSMKSQVIWKASWFADYRVPFIQADGWSKTVAGIFGVLIILLLLVILTWIRSKPQSREPRACPVTHRSE